MSAGAVAQRCRGSLSNASGVAVRIAYRSGERWRRCRGGVEHCRENLLPVHAPKRRSSSKPGASTTMRWALIRALAIRRPPSSSQDLKRQCSLSQRAGPLRDMAATRPGTLHHRPSRDNQEIICTSGLGQMLDQACCRELLHSRNQTARRQLPSSLVEVPFPGERVCRPRTVDPRYLSSLALNSSLKPTESKSLQVVKSKQANLWPISSPPRMLENQAKPSTVVLWRNHDVTDEQAERRWRAERPGDDRDQSRVRVVPRELEHTAMRALTARLNDAKYKRGFCP